MTDMIEKVKGDYGVVLATYLSEKLPENPTYEIVKFVPNPYYGKEDDYEEDKDMKGYYVSGPHSYIHESCFRNPEQKLVVARLYYHDAWGKYRIEVIEDNFLDLSQEGWGIVVSLAKEVLDRLNKNRNSWFEDRIIDFTIQLHGSIAVSVPDDATDEEMVDEAIRESCISVGGCCTWSIEQKKLNWYDRADF